MGFPTNNVHRRNRRGFGRGQGPAIVPVGCVVTGAASTVTLTFAQPVNVSGTIPITVATLTIVSQTIVSPTVVTILMSGTVATHAYNVPSPVPNVSSYEGQPVIGSSGTF